MGTPEASCVWRKPFLWVSGRTLQAPAIVAETFENTGLDRKRFVASPSEEEAGRINKELTLILVKWSLSDTKMQYYSRSTGIPFFMLLIMSMISKGNALDKIGKLTFTLHVYDSYCPYQYVRYEWICKLHVVLNGTYCHNKVFKCFWTKYRNQVQ